MLEECPRLSKHRASRGSEQHALVFLLFCVHMFYGATYDTPLMAYLLTLETIPTADKSIQKTGRTFVIYALATKHAMGRLFALFVIACFATTTSTPDLRLPTTWKGRDTGGARMQGYPMGIWNGSRSKGFGSSDEGLWCEDTASPQPRLRSPAVSLAGD